MPGRISRIINRIVGNSIGVPLQVEIENIKILQARLLQRENIRRADAIIKNIQQAEFKVFSQFGDDGIIQFLVDYLNPAKCFVELGVENYLESNTRFLLMNNNWKGFIVDGSPENIQQCKDSYFFWRHNLTAVDSWITKENVNDLIRDKGKLAGNIGLLHIDLDGNDYWIWDAINVVSPQIVILEYNSVFQLNPWTVPYDEKFYRTDAHYSGLYYGSSLKALYDLSIKKGYTFIGCNTAGNNAYFLRNDFTTDTMVRALAEGYVESQFRESRDRQGHLTYLSSSERLQSLRGTGLKVFNTDSKQTEIL